MKRTLTCALSVLLLVLVAGCLTGSPNAPRDSAEEEVGQTEEPPQAPRGDGHRHGDGCGHGGHRGGHHGGHHRGHHGGHGGHGG